MDAISHPAPTYSPLRSYLLEAKCEFLHQLRTPSFVLPLLLFPALFYTLFGIVLNRSPDGEVARYLLATYGVFGVMGTGLFGFGVTVAMERERGFLIYKRALPMPPGAYLFAKMVMAMLFALMVSLLLALLAMTLADVSMAPRQWLLLLAVNVIGVLPFCALGLFIGTRVGGQASPTVINLLYLPMAFLSGLWLPLKMLPAVISDIAPTWPSYHLAQIALKVLGMDGGGALGTHVAVLVGVTAVFFLLARRRLRRNG